MFFQVLEPGFMTTVQDLGRSGYQRFGVPECGAMDRFALMAANLLVRNQPHAAALESLFQGPRLKVSSDCLIAAAGVGFELLVNQTAFPLWMSIYVRAGSEIYLRGISGAMWGYLAFAGEVDAPPVMGSKSTYLRGSFGGFKGRALQSGDVLSIMEHGLPQAWSCEGGRFLPEKARLHYQTAGSICVIRGPQVFSDDAWNKFTSSGYTISHKSDRMGYRLDGAPLEHLSGADILSEGIALGAVQVPGDGQPIVMMSDRQTTGGYAKIATVISVDLPVLVQCLPGSRPVYFEEVSVEKAQDLYASVFRNLLLQMEDE